MTTATLELTRDQIDANRRRVIRALKRSRNQCYGTLFKGNAACALGVCTRALLGLRNNAQIELYEGGAAKVYDDVEYLLGESDEGLRWLWRLNDRVSRSLTLPEIGAECERRWFGAS